MPYIVMELDPNGHTNFCASFATHEEADEYCKEKMSRPMEETVEGSLVIEHPCPPDYMWIVESKAFYSSV